MWKHLLCRIKGGHHWRTTLERHRGHEVRQCKACGYEQYLVKMDRAGGLWWTRPKVTKDR